MKWVALFCLVFVLFGTIVRAETGLNFSVGYYDSEKIVFEPVSQSISGAVIYRAESSGELFSKAAVVEEEPMGVSEAAIREGNSWIMEHPLIIVILIILLLFALLVAQAERNKEI